ncbi:MAG: hypothetical protein IKO55_14025 [Kiritimatiellae bacterium]|nr:hypothetical protein [Kiritimatiellia bacterium]
MEELVCDVAASAAEFADSRDVGAARLADVADPCAEYVAAELYVRDGCAFAQPFDDGLPAAV